MLCGLVGSGKTTYARRLEASGCVRLAIDEWIFERHGRHGVDYNESEYPTHEESARAELDQRLVDLIQQGRDVVLDYGFWSRQWRDRYKQLIQDAGAEWRLLYLKSNWQRSVAASPSGTASAAPTRSSSPAAISPSSSAAGRHP